MKNNYLITDLGPHLLVDHSLHRPSRPWGSWVMGLALWAAVLGILCWMTLGEAHAQSTQSDPMVMKVYPDGTKVVLRWSEVGKQVDNGEKYGGAPRIVAYDPAKDGIVPIGEPSPKSETASTNAAVPPSSSVISPDQPARLDYAAADSNDEVSDHELSGFYISPEMGMAINSNLNFRTVSGYVDENIAGGYELSGSATSSLSVNPGIRFNLPLGYSPVEWFAIEFAPGIIWNPLNTLTVQYQGTLNDPAGDPVAGDAGSLALQAQGGYYQVPLVLNFMFRIPTDSPWTPYVGGGIGATYSYLNITNLKYAPAGINENISSTDGSCWSLAYQAIGGFDYQINENISIGAKYIFMGTGNQNFEGQLSGLSSKGSISQSALVNCTISF